MVVGTNLMLTKYGPDLIFGEPRIIVSPLTMLVNNVYNIGHGISAIAQESNEP
jgi:hypothetical protein